MTRTARPAPRCIPPRRTRRSNFHQLRFFGRKQLVDLGDELVRELLTLVLGAPFLVLGHRFVLEQFLEIVVGVATNVAYRHLGALGLAAHVLVEFAATLFGERRQRKTKKKNQRHQKKPKNERQEDQNHHLHH